MAARDKSRLSADGGTIIVSGAVTGSGFATIDAATLDLATASSLDVTFTGSTGVLVLAQSQVYTGSIAHFSYVGVTSLDLLDIGFVNAKEATYAGSSKDGVLTVTDGAHTAHIDFTGNYRASQFVASSDGHGGVIIVDPTPSASPSVQSFVAAAASLGGSAAAAIQPHAIGPAFTERSLWAPRAAQA